MASILKSSLITCSTWRLKKDKLEKVLDRKSCEFVKRGKAKSNFKNKIQHEGKRKWFEYYFTRIRADSSFPVRNSAAISRFAWLLKAVFLFCNSLSLFIESLSKSLHRVALNIIKISFCQWWKKWKKQREFWKMSLIEDTLHPIQVQINQDQT